MEARRSLGARKQDNEQGPLYMQPIAQWHHRGQQEVFEYTLEDGSIIQATAEHQFMTANGQMYPIQQIFEEGLSLKQMPLPWQIGLQQAS